jgi:hypothetical protein
MAAKKSWKQAKEKRDPGAFIPVPMSVLNSQAYLKASAHARMLLFDLFMQYRGSNNGDFCAAWTLMKPRGWKSEDTLAKAKKQLLDLGLIVETRKGARPNKASLYAVTWCALDDCGGKLDVSAKSFQRGLYLLLNPAPSMSRKNAALTTPAVVETAAIATPAVADDAPSTTPAVSIWH